MGDNNDFIEKYFILFINLFSLKSKLMLSFFFMALLISFVLKKVQKKKRKKRRKK